LGVIAFRRSLCGVQRKIVPQKNEKNQRIKSFY
jgi:hypothetical protein